MGKVREIKTDDDDDNQYKNRIEQHLV